jgi:hypothetical protein
VEVGALGHLAMLSAGLIVASHPPPRLHHRMTAMAGRL